ncbi:MAG: homoserine O-acetyltransferase [Chitinophagaceae bacterium]|nr:MAG: homoserine O-acetyltransferase [Chitinophagaceae bacterium]
MVNQFTYPHRFDLEQGGSLPHLEITYATYGKKNADGSNVVWICHALTANADVAEWWPGFVGKGFAIDPEKYFIICANIIGSCYGSSGPLSISAETGAAYYSGFPLVTIRDMVRGHIILRQQLGIIKIHLLIGGSMGGYQALEWALMEPQAIERLMLLATSASESAWGIAVHTAQRLALTADSSWNDHGSDAGKNGMKAARAIGMLTYRNYSIMVKSQSDDDCDKLDDFKAASYITYQGEKLANRFNAYSYWLLTKAMDTHNIARGRKKSIAALLGNISLPVLVIGISSDILCPAVEQQQLAEMMPNATLVEIDSAYGHDGFMVETQKISAALNDWLLKL